jgi:hypothetical protein
VYRCRCCRCCRCCRRLTRVGGGGGGGGGVRRRRRRRRRCCCCCCWVLRLWLVESWVWEVSGGGDGGWWGRLPGWLLVGCWLVVVRVVVVVGGDGLRVGWGCGGLFSHT